MLEWITVKLMPKADVIIYPNGRFYFTGHAQKRLELYKSHWKIVEDVQKKRLAMLFDESGRDASFGYTCIPCVVARDYLGKFRLLPLGDKGYILEPIE